MRVGFSQMKNGLPAAFALSRNVIVAARISSSAVSSGEAGRRLRPSPTDLSPARMHGGVVLVARPAVGMLRGPTVFKNSGG